MPAIPANDLTPIDQLDDDAWVRQVRRAVALPDAPPHCLQAALALWPTVAPLPARQVGIGEVAGAALRLVQAVLGFDSWAQPALAAGVRSAVADTRHLLFNAAGRDVDLRIRNAPAGYVLSGQILGPDEAGELELVCRAPALAGADPRTRRAVLDELGEFRLEGVPAGTYELTLRVGTDRIMLPAIDVGDGRR